MRYCEKCHVTVRTGQKKCPLCQSELSGNEDPKDRIFPDIEVKKTNLHRFMEWMTFGCIFIVVVCLAVNWIVDPGYWWSAFVAAGAAMAWLATMIGISKRRNLLKNALWQTIWVEVALLIWDAVTGFEKWSLTYFLPIGLMALLVFLIVISMVQKLDSPEYMIYWIMAAVFGLLPLLFLALRIVTVRLPSILCAGSSVILLAGIFTLQRKAALNELQKKFHL